MSHSVDDGHRMRDGKDDFPFELLENRVYVFMLVFERCSSYVFVFFGFSTKVQYVELREPNNG